MATCESCNRLIRWAVTSNGGSIPLDPDPRSEGNIALVESTYFDGVRQLTRQVAVVLNAEELADVRADRADRTLYLSHLATCPMAKMHRRRTSR